MSNIKIFPGLHRQLAEIRTALKETDQMINSIKTTDDNSQGLKEVASEILNNIIFEIDDVLGEEGACNEPR